MTGTRDTRAPAGENGFINTYNHRKNEFYEGNDQYLKGMEKRYSSPEAKDKYFLNMLNNSYEKTHPKPDVN
ncbi:MAG: hypothetical protein RJQ14_27210 [Marinoscillum sp.]